PADRRGAPRPHPVATRPVPPPLARRGASCFFLTDRAPTEIYTLSLHDALPICGGAARPRRCEARAPHGARSPARGPMLDLGNEADRKSTRLNSSHVETSYAVFCLKKKNGSARPR